ncbi:MAG: type II secretion system F family protein [Clostridiales bacterium]|jgi:tight adherence protein B|nr:type II secretion system F family protein [Clostridiales bacterium]
MEAFKISVLVFFSTYLILKAATSRMTKGKEEISQRVQALTRDSSSEKISLEEKSFREKLLGIFRALAPKKLLASSELELSQADILLKPEELAIIQIAVIIVPILLGQLIFQSVAFSLMFALIGAVAPTLFIKQAKAKRLKRFNDQLGEGLAIMSNSLRAGYSFLQTLESLQKEGAEPMSTEFGRALREMRLGTPTEEALHNMTKRVASEDFDLVVTAVSIQRQVGGNLAEVLDNIAFTIKERVRIKGEVRTLTAQGRISGLIVGLLPVFLAGFISVTNPAYMSQLIKHPVGLVMIGGALVSELVGAMMIKKIVNIDY